MRVLDRRRIQSVTRASHIRHEVDEALADPCVTTLDGFLRRLFMGAPNTGIDQGFVVERFDLARRVLEHPHSDQQVMVDGARAVPWSSTGAHAFLSAGLPDTDPPEDGGAHDYVFRFVDSSLHVPGNFVLSGPLLVAGNLRVDGVILSHGHRDLMVLGDVHCRAIECMRGHVLIDGSLSASELVVLDDLAEAQIAGNLLSPGLLTNENGCSGITVGGDDDALRVDMDDPVAPTLFGDSVIGTEDASLSWHLKRALMRGTPIWRRMPGSHD